jgi:hypothetical protein
MKLRNVSALQVQRGLAKEAEYTHCASRLATKLTFTSCQSQSAVAGGATDELSEGLHVHRTTIRWLLSKQPWLLTADLTESLGKG